jgi:hypothetical protein
VQERRLSRRQSDDHHFWLALGAGRNGWHFHAGDLDRHRGARCLPPRLSHPLKAEGEPCEKIDLVETFSRAYAAASPDQQAALRAWMRGIILPRKQRRNDFIRSLRDSIAARDGRILEFPLSMSPNAIEKP